MPRSSRPAFVSLLRPVAFLRIACLGFLAACDPDPAPRVPAPCVPGAFRTSDGVCETCPRGTFSSSQDALQCAPHRRCWAPSTPGTSTTDAICGRRLLRLLNVSANEIAIDSTPRLILAGSMPTIGNGFTDATLTGVSDLAPFLGLREAEFVDLQDWTRTFGTTGANDRVGDIALGPEDEIFVVGSTDRPNATTGLTDSSALIGAYPRRGIRLWRTSEVPTSDARLYAAAADSQGNLVVAGETDSPLADSERKALVRKYDTSGRVVWERTFDAGRFGLAADVAIDAYDMIYVVGHAYGDLSGGTSALSGFVRKMSPWGSDVWTRQFGPGVAAHMSSVVVTDDGVVAAGLVSGLESYDVIVRSFDEYGTVRWTQQFGTNQSDEVAGLAFHPPSTLYLVGNTRGDFGGALGNQDAFVRRIRIDGTTDWLVQFGSDAYDAAHGIAVSPDGIVHVVGSTFGTFGGPQFDNASSFIMQLEDIVVPRP